MQIYDVTVTKASGLPFEWLIYRYHVILREFFNDVGIRYLDLWDMTLLWPTWEYHPETPVIQEQAFLMSRYVCK